MSSNEGDDNEEIIVNKRTVHKQKIEEVRDYDIEIGQRENAEVVEFDNNLVKCFNLRSHYIIAFWKDEEHLSSLRFKSEHFLKILKLCGFDLEFAIGYLTLNIVEKISYKVVDYDEEIEEKIVIKKQRNELTEGEDKQEEVEVQAKRKRFVFPVGDIESEEDLQKPDLDDIKGCLVKSSRGILTQWGNY